MNHTVKMRMLCLCLLLCVSLFQICGCSSSAPENSRSAENSDSEVSQQKSETTADQRETSGSTVSTDSGEKTRKSAGTNTTKAAASGSVYTPAKQQYATVKGANPLKGLMPFKGDYHTIPYSMEWWYIPLNTLMNGMNSYTFESGLEPVLNEIAGRGNQAALRVYLDYPDSADGTPAFIWDMGIKKYTYTNMGKGVYPDYTDQRLIDILEQFIKEFGKRYDGDPRIAYLTCGLIGHWGEWHNYPDNLMPDSDQKFQLLEAYSTAFLTTPVLARYPDDTGLREYNFGFHDDSFTESTLDNSKSSYFYTKMKRVRLTERWKTAAIGGEFRPENQLPFLNGTKYQEYYQDYSACVDATHCSWLVFHKAFAGDLTAEQKQRAEEASRQLGYDLHVSSSCATVNGNHITLQVTVENRGVAPVYYNWKVKIGAVRNGKLVSGWDTDWKLKEWLPGDPIVLSTDIDAAGLKAGDYTLVMAVENPLKNGKQLKFANALQDADLSGWLTLGHLTK